MRCRGEKFLGAGRRLITLPAIVALFAVGGCGGDATGPESGLAEAFVQDDPGSVMTAVVPARALSGRATSVLPTLAGSAAGDFQAAISSDGETWIDLGSPNGITVQLQISGEGTSVHGEQDVAVATYTWVRLVIRDVEITVNAGSEVDGVTLDADAKLSLAAGEGLVIEREVGPITVTSDSRIQIAFDLNSEAWLTAEVIAAGTVSESEVAASVTAVAGQ